MIERRRHHDHSAEQVDTVQPRSSGHFFRHQADDLGNPPVAQAPIGWFFKILLVFFG
jgi:hypothetical protein